MSSYKHTRSFSDFRENPKDLPKCQFCHSEPTNFALFLGKERSLSGEKESLAPCKKCFVKIQSLERLRDAEKNKILEVEQGIEEKKKHFTHLQRKIQHCRATQEKIDAFSLKKFCGKKDFEKEIEELMRDNKEIVKKIAKAQEENWELEENVRKSREQLGNVRERLRSFAKDAKITKEQLANIKNHLAELQDRKIEQFHMLESINSANLSNFSGGKARTKHEKLQILIKEEKKYIDDLASENESLSTAITFQIDPFLSPPDLPAKLFSQHAELLKSKLLQEKTHENSGFSQHSCSCCTIS